MFSRHPSIYQWAYRRHLYLQRQRAQNLSSSRPWLGWYDTREWAALRASQLRAEPECRLCAKVGRVRPAVVVDHIIPHKGDRMLFFDPHNLQSLCRRCHDSVKQSWEVREDQGCDFDGVPRSRK